MMELTSWLVGIPTWSSAVLVIGFYVSLGMGALTFSRFRLNHSTLANFNDITGFVFSAFAAIYGVMLAFVVIDEMQIFDKVEVTAVNESSAASSLYHALTLYPGKEQTSKAMAALSAFTNTIVQDEFPTIHEGKWKPGFQANSPGEKALGQLRLAIGEIVPQNLHEQAIFSEIFRDLNELSKYRSQRLLQTDSNLPFVIWVETIFGAIFLVIFSCMFGHGSWRHQLVVATLFSALIGSMLEVVVVLNLPFQGDYCVHPEGYKLLIEQMKLAGMLAPSLAP